MVKIERNKVDTIVSSENTFVLVIIDAGKRINENYNEE